DDTIEILSDEEVEFLPDTETDLLMDGGEGGTGETTPGTGAGSGEADAGTGEETDDTIEILSDEEVEFLPDTETDLLMDAGEGGTGGTTPGTGTGSGEADAGTEEETDDTIEILSDEEVEFLPDTEIDLLMGGGGGGTGETTPGTGAGSGEADAGTGEETDDTFEILSDEEVEFVDDDSSPSGVAGEKPHPPFLEIISKYLEPDETLTPDLLLTEDNDSLASILSRFTPIYIKIPAGRYPIGCPDPGPSEHPADEIILPDFFMGQYPVTNDLFELFIRETGYETDAEKAGFGIVYQGRFQSGLDHKSGKATLTIIKRGNVKKVAGADWRYPSGPAGPSIITKTNQPVVQVSHRDALAFASWAGKRLPSEEEWEAAAHGPRYSPYPWGSEWHQDFANFRSSRLGDTTPVDRNPKKAMSPFGLLDLLGNVYEWTTSHLNTAGPDRRTTWLLKGGCWNSPGPVTISHRLVESRTWSNIIGFRCAV
ncbi:MAG: formylglycine-generating enzyme family protein, partial [Proteobacteria bacterium]|nr:formylglycine-generating enzyme family protein [Pseudomonadota bacterium]